MKKTLLINTFVVTFFISIFINKEIIMESVKTGIDIWYNSLLPSLFPFLIITHLMIKLDFIKPIKEILKPIFNILKIDANISFVLIMSILGGTPTNAGCIKELYKEKRISKIEAEKALTFTYFSNPLFILGTVGIVFLNNKHIGLLIFLSHILSEIIIYIIFNHLIKTNFIYEKTNISSSIKTFIKEEKEKHFSKILTESIKEAFNTCLMILGTIIFIYVLTESFSFLMPKNPLINSTIRGILEITSGLSNISNLNIDILYKGILSTMLISFGGISIYIQIISILEDTDLSTFPYFIARILHSSISGIMFYIFYLTT